MKEFIRKRIVALKRKPHTIALLGLAAAFVYFSFNLTQVSNTTASFQMDGMGLSAFVIMLFSVLVIVCFLNAFPHRKKVNIPMLVLMFLMLGATIFCNVFYDNCIDQALQARWDDTYNKHVSDAIEAVEEARESSLTNAELAVQSAEALESAKAAVAGAAAAAEEAKAIAAELEAAAPAAEAAAAALAQAEEALASVETAAATITANAAEVEAAAAAAEAAADLKTAKAESKDATAVAKKSKNVAKNVEKAADKAAEALSAANAALAEAKAALVESRGEEIVPEQPAEAPAEAAAEQTAEQKAEEKAIVLSDALYAEAEQKGDETVTSLLEKDAFINATSAMMDVHRIILIVALALVALLPVYTPLLRKIRTSIEVEANEDMGEIELNGSDE